MPGLNQILLNKQQPLNKENPEEEKVREEEEEEGVETSAKVCELGLTVTWPTEGEPQISLTGDWSRARMRILQRYLEQAYRKYLYELRKGDK